MAEVKFPQLKTDLPGPKAQQIIQLDDQMISPSYTRAYPLVASRGYGAMVEDVDGNVFLDFAAGIAVVATGHCHPRVVQAIQKQAAELIHMSGTDFYYTHMVEFAQKLASVTPGAGPKRVFYTNSGTEAVEAAIKLARYATRRDKLVAFLGCFHGRTMGSLSLTASKSVQRKGFGPLLPGVVHLPYPYCYRCPYNLEPKSCGLECARVLEREIFKKLADPEDIAAVFIEPIQGEGGYVPAPVEFLQELQRICRQHGILLVVDEVQSGMGRTGRWWACEHAGIEPDILCVAKGIASGMPLGAIVARTELMTWKPGAHASTFGGNPVCLAAALATFALLEGGLIESARRVGEHIFARLADWPQRHRIVGDVRGHGLMVGIELVRDQKTKEPAQDLRNEIVNMAFHKGLLLLGAGECSLRLCPPLVVDTDQADFALEIIEECISKLERNL